jgi:hypothetical protein
MSAVKENWHIEKSISVGHLLTTIILVIGGFTFVNDQDKRISANTQSIEFIKVQRQEDMRRIENQLEIIDKKLDKIISSNIYAKL